MAPPSEHVTPAIVLHSREYSESDKIVVFLTRDFGKVHGIAKGAKRSKRRFANVLEPFSHVNLRFRQPRNSDLVLVVACDAIKLFRNLTRDFVRYAYGTYVLELVDKVTKGREVSAASYHLVCDVLFRVDEESPPCGLLRAFELRLLRQLGYLPRLGSCRKCGCALGDQPSVYFRPGNNGFLCRQCHTGGGGFVVSDKTVEFLTNLQREPFDRIPTHWLEPPALVAAEARVLLRGFFGASLSGPLKSDKLLETALAES